MNNTIHAFFFITTDLKVKPFIWNKGVDWLEGVFFKFIIETYPQGVQKHFSATLNNQLEHIEMCMEESPFKTSLVQIINKWLADIERHKNMTIIESKK